MVNFFIKPHGVIFLNNYKVCLIYKSITVIFFRQSNRVNVKVKRIGNLYNLTKSSKDINVIYNTQIHIRVLISEYFITSIYFTKTCNILSLFLLCHIN